MKISQYLVTLQHDKGKVTIQTAAVSPAQAARIVTDSEGAPLNSVLEVVEYKPRQKSLKDTDIDPRFWDSVVCADGTKLFSAKGILPEGGHITKIKV